MKILITGSTANQSLRNHWLRMQLKIIPSTYSLYNCLVDMGHEVKQRQCILGEELSEFDEVVVFLASPANISAGYLYNALYAISQRPNCIIAFDDWQIEFIYLGLMKMLKQDNVFHDYAVKNWLAANTLETIENLYSYESAFKESLDILYYKTNRVLLSAFDGGNLKRALDWPLKLLFGYNPNPYHFHRKPGSFFHPEETKTLSLFKNEEHAYLPEHKRFVFNFSSLIQSVTDNWLRQQGISKWTIKYYGSKNKGQDRYIEGQMCQIYANQWACLMPGYYNKGSGWWRAKPLQIADAGSVLIGDFDEIRVIYNDDGLAVINAHDIEQMDEDQLIKFASSQKEAIYSTHPLSKETQKFELNSILESR